MKIVTHGTHNQALQKVTTQSWQVEADDIIMSANLNLMLIITWVS